MNKLLKIILPFLFILYFSFFAPIKGQISYFCSYSPRIAIAGDSWAQYMADDNTYSKILNMYGQADKGAISETFEIAIGLLCSETPDANDYAVSGSEARQWADEANFDYLQNLIDALNANPTVDFVLLSIGGNDILAAKSGGGWYKDMDLDTLGSEQALFNTVQADTEYIMNQVWLRARPDINFVISGYDFPNFNVTGSFFFNDYCEQYACPKRKDLSRDPVNDLITDLEISQMMETVESIRKSMAMANPKIFYDNGMGLMHYYYGYDDGLYPFINSGVTAYPGGLPPYSTGGDAGTPTDRDNFRSVPLCLIDGVEVGGFAADPIHLDAEGYEYKIKNQFDNIFFEEFRGTPTETFWSVGAEDGYVDIIDDNAFSNGIRVGDDDTGIFFGLDNEYMGIFSFNTSSIPDNATITGASLYMIKSGENDNPFFHNDRFPILDIKNGYFGDDPVLHHTDGEAAANATNIGCFHGNGEFNKYAIRVDITPSGLSHLNTTGATQFRMRFSFADYSPEYINFYDGGGNVALLPPEVEALQNPTQYEYRSVKRIVLSDGTIEEVELSRGPAIHKRDGYVYQEKVKDIKENEDGDRIVTYQVMAAIEHPGLAKHMSEIYGAPANGYAPFLDVSYVLPLPADLTDFTAIPTKDKESLLNWETSAERNHQGFYVEHSIDNNVFEEIGFVASNQNSSTIQKYNFIHSNPAIGKNYYRLRSTDLDGSFDYSEIRLVQFGKEGQLVNIHPNPFTVRLTFELDFAKSGQAMVQITDLLGRVVFDESILVSTGLNGYTIEDLSDLAIGTYLIRVFDGNEMFLGKVVKQ